MLASVYQDNSLCMRFQDIGKIIEHIVWLISTIWVFKLADKLGNIPVRYEVFGVWAFAGVVGDCEGQNHGVLIILSYCQAF